MMTALALSCLVLWTGLRALLAARRLYLRHQGERELAELCRLDDLCWVCRCD